MTLRRTWMYAIAGAAVGLPFTSTHAQTPPAEEQVNALEEITVTARRREESQQTVPISVAALTADALERNEITNSIDLQRQVPGLSVTAASPTRDQFSFGLRGQRTQEFQLLTDAPVGTYFAEVVQPRPTGFGQVLFDLQNVQVLKGVQGTLFGRNMTGGAVLVEPAHPTDELLASASLTGGNYDLRRAEAMVNLPVGDIVSVRLAGMHNEHDGYTQDLTTGRDFDDDDADAWRASVLIKPLDGLESLFIYDGMQNRKNGTAVNFGHAATPNAACFGPPNVCRPIDLYSPPLNAALGLANAQAVAATQEARNEDRDFAIGSAEQRAAFAAAGFGSGLPYSRVDNWGLTNKTQYAFGDYTIKNVVGYRHMKWDQLQDLDGSVLPWIYSRQAQDIKTISEELQLQGSSLDSALTWIVGGYFFKEYGLDTATSSQFPELARLQPGASSLTAFNTLLYSPGRGTAKTTAAFASGTYSLTDQWKLTAGARYTTDKREVKVTPTRPFLPTGPASAGLCAWNDDAATTNAVNFATGNCSHSDSEKWNAFTWDLTAQYQATDELMAYASVRRGFRAGGFSLRAQSADELQPFDPEYVVEYEIGSKSDWRFANDQALRANVALFYQDYTDVQRQVRTSENNVVKTVVLNTPKQEIYGGELELTYVPIQDLSISAAYSLIKSHVLDAGINPHTGAEIQVPYPLVGSAENTVNVTGLYTVPLAGTAGDLEFNASWFWQGKSHLVDSDAEGTESSFDLLNLKASWLNVFGSGVDVAAFCNNVTDEFYRVGVISLQSTGVGYTGDLFGDPRTYGVEVKYSFGR